MIKHTFTTFFLIPLIFAVSIKTMAQINTNSSYEIVFTKPYLKDDKDKTIRDRFISLINSASADSTIKVSFYSIKSEKVTKSLIAAHKRGVTTQIIFDGKMSAKSNPNDLLSAINYVQCSPNEKKSCLLFCNAYGNNNGCLSNERGSINHNKFATISKLKNGEKNIVIQTSHNMTASQTKKFNDLLVFKNNSELYADYNKYWEDQARMNQNQEYAQIKTLGNITSYRFPFAYRDPIIDIFDSIDCSQPGGAMHASVAFFRRKNVAKKIKQMKIEGCDIKVISDKLLSKNKLQKVIGEDVYKRTSGIHSKFVTLKGIDKKTGQSVYKVLTGSHNFTYAGLKENDETLLEINDFNIYQIYEAAFKEFYLSL